MNCSLPGSSVHGVFQARILEWVAISFSRGSSQPRDWTRDSHVLPASAGRFFTSLQGIFPTQGLNPGLSCLTCFGNLPDPGTEPGPLMSHLLRQAGSLPVGFPGGTVVNSLPANAGKTRDAGSISGLGRSPGGGAWQSTPVFLAGKPHGQRSLAGYSPRNRKEWTMTEHTHAMESICTIPSKKKSNKGKKKIKCKWKFPDLKEISSLLTQMVKNLRAMQETQDQSLGWEDPLEEKMATDSSILSWKIP